MYCTTTKRFKKQETNVQLHFKLMCNPNPKFCDIDLGFFVVVFNVVFTSVQEKSTRFEYNVSNDRNPEGLLSCSLQIVYSIDTRIIVCVERWTSCKICPKTFAIVHYLPSTQWLLAFTHLPNITNPVGLASILDYWAPTTENAFWSIRSSIFSRSRLRWRRGSRRGGGGPPA